MLRPTEKFKLRKISLGWRRTARRTGACVGYAREESESEFGRVSYETAKRIKNEGENKEEETEKKR